MTIFAEVLLEVTRSVTSERYLKIPKVTRVALNQVIITKEGHETGPIHCADGGRTGHDLHKIVNILVMFLTYA